MHFSARKGGNIADLKKSDHEHREDCFILTMHFIFYMKTNQQDEVIKLRAH